jgi:DNA-binding transcriptional LysR family regulator
MQSIDLNLLPVAVALLDTGSVTAAADRLHLSVPATSRALARCRRTFGDPLLVRRGRGLVITPRGTELLAELAPLLDRIGEIVSPPGPFEPTTAGGTVVVRANETIIAALGGRMIGALAAEAPGIDVRFVLESADDLDALAAGDADLAIGSYHGAPPDCDSAHLATERLVGVLRAGHPLARGRMTVPRFASLHHVAVSRRGIARGPLDDLLAAEGHRRAIATVVPSYAAALAMCVDSDLTTLAPSRLADLFAGAVHVFEPPVELPIVDVAVWWHRRSSADPTHRWLRERVVELAAPVSRPRGGRR